MAEVTEPVEERGKARTFYGRLAAGAAGLATLAVVIALSEPEAPESFLDGRAGIFLLLFGATLSAAAIRQVVEWQRGKAPMAGPWWTVARAKLLFQLALVGAVPALGIITALAWAVGGAWAELLWRAWILLLVGGAILGIIGSLIADLLFLLLPRRN